MRPPFDRLCLAATLLLTSCGGDGETGTASSSGPLGFPECARERGLDHLDRSGTPAKDTVLEANGPGVALLDLGPDGDWDVALSSGAASLPALLAGDGSDLALFENDGGAHFSPVEGPGLRQWLTGLAVGDLDADGDGDLVAGAFGDLTVLLQDGGRLVARTPAATPIARRTGARLIPGEAREAGHPPDWVTSLALLDADRDGALDLYVGRYLDLDPVAPPRGRLGTGALAVPCRWKGHPVFCGPRGMTPQPDSLWRGDGRGGFGESTWLPTSAPGFTLAVHAFDADLDGDTDLYVANDSVANHFLINELDTGPSKFIELAELAGIALSPDGAPEAGMGIASGDVDDDGRFDLVLTNFSDEPTHLFLGADVGFDAATHRFGLGAATRRLLSWSCHLADFDADGSLELFTANGHVYPQADEPGTGTSYGQRDTLLELAGGRASESSAPWYRTEDSLFAVSRGSRGSAVGDLDGDGVPDLVVTSIDGPVSLGLSRLAPARRVLALRLVGSDTPGPEGKRTPRDAQGTLVVVEDEHGLQRRQVSSAVGYQSASSTEVLFGFAPGIEAGYRRIELRWPSGRVEQIVSGPWNRRLLVHEGEGVVLEESL